MQGSNIQKESKMKGRIIFDPFLLQIIIGTFISVVPLLIYISFFDKEDDGAWMGHMGFLIIQFMRGLK